MDIEEPPIVRLDARDVEDAIEKLLDFLRAADDSKDSNKRPFFYHGLSGLGASYILRAVAGLLKSPSTDMDTRNNFGKIIHVDCSLWKSRRAMQKIIAEELGLHNLLPEFDEKDEEDDFRGVTEGSRKEIAIVGRSIFQSLKNERFLMIFHCGTDDDIDLEKSGIPVTFGDGKILWTNYGRFKLFQNWESRSINIIGAGGSPEIFWPFFHAEVAEVILFMGMGSISPELVVDCYVYLLSLIIQVWRNPTPVDYGWVTHACNYWICDGILQGDTSWELGNALHGLIQTPPSYYSHGIIFMEGNFPIDKTKLKEKWVSVIIDQEGAQRTTTIPINVSSYFLTYKGNDQLELKTDLFQLANNLHVLKLDKCSFDFSSPPFRCCQKLRFLWLDHCTDNGTRRDVVPCFPDLLVLQLRFTDFVLLMHVSDLVSNLRELNTKGVSWKTISHRWKELPNLLKLRVTESSEVITTDSFSSIDMFSLELLDLSNNTQMESLPDLSLAQRLKMLILDGCSSLEHVTLEKAPLLEIFSFDGYGSAESWTHSINLPKEEWRPESHESPFEAKVSNISLQGCGRLHSIFLRALPNLWELNLSNTAIKRLDINAMDVIQLKGLFLLGCEQLRSLLWEEDPKLKVLRVDTRGKTARSGFCCGEHAVSEFEAQLTSIDGRFISSFMLGLYRSGPYGFNAKVHFHFSSTIHNQVYITKRTDETAADQASPVYTRPIIPYMDIVLVKDDVSHSALFFDSPQRPLDIHVEIGEGSHHLESIQDNFCFNDFARCYLQSLHVHDNSSITAVPIRSLRLFSSSWHELRWCHIERCPKLQTIFTWTTTGDRESSVFCRLVTFSASDLPMAYCIWDRGINNLEYQSFESLQHLYLNNCPSLLFVLPISFDLPSLETIQIEYCGKLKNVFPLDDKYPDEISAHVEFNKLKHIKLWHLHSLQQICEARLFSAPALETITLRDCWGLRRLPAVVVRDPKPIVDCEKDLWDKLEWDGVEVGHDPSLFRTRHSAYYKKTIRNVAFLSELYLLLLQFATPACVVLQQRKGGWLT
ncbi:hypothetical protein ACP70R_003408 [Stipagrostis hirtigluma subsp. patula]